MCTRALYVDYRWFGEQSRKWWVPGWLALPRTGRRWSVFSRLTAPGNWASGCAHSPCSPPVALHVCLFIFLLKPFFESISLLFALTGFIPQQLEVILPVSTKSAFTTSIKLARQATWPCFLLLKTLLCEKSHSKVSNILIRAKNSAKPNALRSGKSTITTVSHMMEGFLTILAEFKYLL